MRAHSRYSKPLRSLSPTAALINGRKKTSPKFYRTARLRYEAGNIMARAATVRVMERDIQRTCTEFLEWDGWRSLRTDPVSRREWGKGFGEPGMADHLYIRYGPGFKAAPDIRRSIVPTDADVLWIEWKRLRPSKNGKTWGRATKAAIHQKAWHVLERKRGGLTLIAGEDFPASIEGFQDWYRKSGLQRRHVA